MGDLAERLFGPCAAAVALRVAPLDAPPVFAHAEEQAAIAHAIEKRRREFATGRRLAHELLAALELDAGPLLAGPDRAPLWPAGALGTISHGAGRCAVAVARRGALAGLGIDVEEADPLPERLWRIVLRPAEQERARAAGAGSGLAAKLVFSAKEAVYKALAADVGRVLEFREVEVELDLAAGAFRAHLLAPEADRLAPEPLLGGLARFDDHVITALARPPSAG